MVSKKQMIDAYGVSARSYLKRCRDRLLEDNPVSLFYAAFELRCCVEARQAEYLEHYDLLKEAKIKPHRLGENAKRIKKIRIGELIGKFEFHLPDMEAFVGYHTPIPDRLRKICETRIDPLRHCQTEYRDPQDSWWSEQREQLLEGYRLAWIACKGDIPMPPLWNQETGETHPVVFDVLPGNEAALRRFAKMSAGKKLQLGVSYLENPPRSWAPDL